MAKREDAAAIIEHWLERDLSAAAHAGQLPAAYEVEEGLDQLREIVAARRIPVLTGDAGVGKTALVYEWVRRVHEGRELPELRGRRFLQFSFRHRAASLPKADKIVAEFQKLAKALIAFGDQVVPFFRDLQLAYRFDLEPHVVSLAHRFPGPILAEGAGSALDSLFEYNPELHEHYVLVRVEEPSLERVGRILQSWSADQAVRRNREFTPRALDRALQLTHRFLVRTRLPRSVLDFLAQMEGIGGNGRPITEKEVTERFCRVHRTPRVLVDPEVPLNLAELEAQFNRRVLGQPEAVRSVVNMIGVVKAGLADSRRPFGVYLFVGPTGVGKTHVAQLLAEYLFGGRDRVIRFNMADYSNERDAFVLFGDPDAHNLQLQRGQLTRRLMGYPFAVLLLDEFEKAHGKVHDRFLQLMDEGNFINGAGETISCRAAIIIATSNAGAELYRGESMGFRRPADRKAMSREVARVLEKHFRFELLNRFDQIVHFHSLSREDIRCIARAELEALQNRAGLAERGLELEVDQSVLDWLTAHGHDPDFGARFLRRTIEREVTTALADAIVREAPPAGSSISLAVRGGHVVARVASPAAAPRPAKEAVALPQGRECRFREFDGESLLAEARRWGAIGAGRLESLAAKREEYGRLLETMNEPAFWEDSMGRGPVLDRFRELDVAIQVEQRLAQPVRTLMTLIDQAGTGPGELSGLARALEAAAAALDEWDERDAEEGPASVWLAISNVDPLHPAGAWVQEVVAMEVAWCRRLRLGAGVAAYALEEDVPTRVILDVEGPGAAAYLAMEEGVHRRFRPQAPDERVRVELVVKAPPPSGAWPEMTTPRRRSGLFGIEVACRGRLDLADRGLGLDFLGASPAVLSHLLCDLARVWSNPIAPPLDPARFYGEDGIGARDPRTGATLPRMKDVLKGNLDKLLAAWRQHRWAEKGSGMLAGPRKP